MDIAKLNYSYFTYLFSSNSLKQILKLETYFMINYAKANLSFLDILTH